MNYALEIVMTVNETVCPTPIGNPYPVLDNLHRLLIFFYDL